MEATVHERSCLEFASKEVACRDNRAMPSNNPIILALLIPCAMTATAADRSSSGEPSGRAGRPNILWITSEDNGRYLGCYGDPVARTPNLDSFASGAVRYLNCFSNAAVCAPARQTLISGMYATSIGGQHMRSKAVFPPGVDYFPKYLRDAGYYTSNNRKTDYNGGPADSKKAMVEAWDESGRKAHWRKSPEGSPFFAVFNIGDSHESSLFPQRWKKRELKTDPSAVKLPAYLPDLPETRRDMARYHDCLESMDAKAGAILAQLESDGLADNTIVFYFADHGGSMPRGKSFAYDSGTRVPLMVRFPDRWKHLAPATAGRSTDRLVGFVDFSATVLNLAGVKIPEHMQGSAFLGRQAAGEREFVHTFRGRRGERYDIVRGVRSKEYLYLRNYTPHLPVMQHNGYSFEIPGYKAWRDAWKRGGLPDVQAQWFEPKDPEELYRIADDPDNVRNLASDPEFASELARHRTDNARHILDVRDSVFFPEGMGGRVWSAYQDDGAYPLSELLELASAVSAMDAKHLPRFEKAMSGDNECVRFWGVAGCVTLGREAAPLKPALVRRLDDSEPLIRLHAARALAGMGDYEKSIPVIRGFLSDRTAELSLQAVLAVDECGLIDVALELAEDLKKVKGQYAARVVAKLREEPK